MLLVVNYGTIIVLVMNFFTAPIVMAGVCSQGLVALRLWRVYRIFAVTVTTNTSYP